MKRKCKHVDVTDVNTIKPWVEDCLRRHKKRYDFRRLILEHGIDKSTYEKAIAEKDFSLLLPVVANIAEDAAYRISIRKLELKPVRIREQQDKTTGKIRMIGCEDAMQQVFDYIAVNSCKEIWDARINIQQCSSIPGRGQIYGMSLIKKYVKADERAMRYARKHRKRYVRKCAYHTKLDVKKCFPNARLENFMRLFKRDCANEDIVWLWEELLMSHRVEGYQGFMIGALVSQWAAQYMLSFLYRKAMEIRYRDKKAVGRMVMFMDDMLLTGRNRKALLYAVKELIGYAKEVLGFEIKENFAIHGLKATGIDMMGYVVHQNGKVEIRSRNFIKARRIMIRWKAKGKLTLSQAKRLASYKGFFKHSDYSGKFTIFKYAQSVISKAEGGKKNAVSTVFRATGKAAVPQTKRRDGRGVAQKGHQRKRRGRTGRNTDNDMGSQRSHDSNAALKGGN